MANPGTLLVSASLLELDLLVAAQEVEDEVEMVVADLLDLATTAASLDTCLVTAPRREPPQTLVPATIATRQVICPGTVHHQLEVAAVKTPASATNVARRATCPVNAQTHLHNLHNPPVEAAASVTHVVRRIILLAIVHKRPTVLAT